MLFKLKEINTYIYGFPQRIHSDQGPNFESKLIRELCTLSGMVKFHTTPYHAAGNGMTERFNQTLLGMLGPGARYFRTI